jgi:hypothetical protein
VIAEIQQHTVMRVLAASGSLLRVRLPDGRSGFVTARFTELATRPLRGARLAAGAPLREAPDPTAVLVDRLEQAEEVGVLGRFGEYLLVQPARGPAGWVDPQD